MTLVALVALVTGCSATAPAPATPSPSAPATTPSPSAPSPIAGPDRIELPGGFAPEGIAIAPDGTAYLGQRNTGAIYRVELATGRGRVITPPGTGGGAQGMKLDATGRLFVAGASGGNARVIDTRTGSVLADYRLVERPTEDNNLVNDTLLTADAWWLTDSRNPVLYRLPLHADGGLPGPAELRKVPLTGALRYRNGINANGIAPTPDGRALLVVQSNTGGLFRVDPDSGVAIAVDLGGASLEDGDGLLLIGRTLYVMQNESATLTVVELDERASSGRVTRRITDPRFDGPTTIAAYGRRLYLPNARFDAPDSPSTPYNLVSVPIPE